MDNPIINPIWFYLADAIPSLGVFLGILVLVDGLFRIQLAVDAREFGISQWWLLHVLGGDFESVRGTLYDKSGCRFVRKIIARASFYVYNNISISSGKSAACRIASV